MFAGMSLRAEKSASGKIFCGSRRRAPNFYPQALTASKENAAVYGESAPEATVGRYISSDPIGLAAGDTNTFSYVWQNPVNWLDSEGLTPDQACVAGVMSYCAALGAELGMAGGGFMGTRVNPGKGTIEGIKTGFWTGAAMGAQLGNQLGNQVCPEADNVAGPTILNKDEADAKRKKEEQERRAKRREDKSRKGPDGATDSAGNPQKPSGQGYRDRENANRGPSGQRPQGPNRSNGRERNIGIDEEHSRRPKGGFR
jgi:uncharacterized protein RhaS with RHS repeats